MPTAFVYIDNAFAVEIDEEGDEDSMIAFAKERALEMLAGLSDSDIVCVVDFED